MLPELLEGIGFVARNFVFASLIGLALFNSLFALSYVTLLPIFADVYFGVGSTGFGLMNAAHGIGALVGTLTFFPFVLSGSVTALTSLDFLGLGMPPGSPSLGELLYQGKANLQAPWLGITGFLVLADAEDDLLLR